MSIFKKTVKLPDGGILTEHYKQIGYDREIDEGCASGMTRFLTLDITNISELGYKMLKKYMKNTFKDYNLCKFIQVAVFNKDNKRYLTVSGITHLMYTGVTAQTIQEDFILTAQRSKAYENVKIVYNFIPIPV